MKLQLPHPGPPGSSKPWGPPLFLDLHLLGEEFTFQLLSPKLPSGKRARKGSRRCFWPMHPLKCPSAPLNKDHTSWCCLVAMRDATIIKVHLFITGEKWEFSAFSPYSHFLVFVALLLWHECFCPPSRIRTLKSNIQGDVVASWSFGNSLDYEARTFIVGLSLVTRPEKAPQLPAPPPPTHSKRTEWEVTIQELQSGSSADNKSKDTLILDLYPPEPGETNLCYL